MNWELLAMLVFIVLMLRYMWVRTGAVPVEPIYCNRRRQQYTQLKR